MTPTPANDNRPAWFDVLLLDYEPYIRSRIGTMEKDTAKYEDIYQEVMAKALERWHLYRPHGNFAGWLYWLIRGVLQKKERAEECELGSRVTEATQEYVVDISLALFRLGGRADEVLLSACGHSEADIAQRIGVRPPTIHYRLKAARAALVAANDNSKVGNAAA